MCTRGGGSVRNQPVAAGPAVGGHCRRSRSRRRHGQRLVSQVSHRAIYDPRNVLYALPALPRSSPTILAQHCLPLINPAPSPKSSCTPLRISCSLAGAILQPQPPPCDSCVSRTGLPSLEPDTEPAAPEPAPGPAPAAAAAPVLEARDRAAVLPTVQLPAAPGLTGHCCSRAAAVHVQTARFEPVMLETTCGVACVRAQTDTRMMGRGASSDGRRAAFGRANPMPPVNSTRK